MTREPVEPLALHPRLSEPDVIAELAAAWARERRLRIEGALSEEFAEALVDAAARHPFAYFEKHVGEVRCLFWRQLQRYPAAGETSSFAPIEAARRLFTLELPRLASAITGQALRANDSEGIAIDFYTRGSYLDAHTDQGADRLIAYVVGLTRERWPVEDGGHLEFLAADHATVVERVTPGWGSLDLFCIYPLTRPHRVPILRAPVTRVSINGWLGGELDASSSSQVER